ncbi:hypothetical protein MKW92_043211 [Papaver armeniacum]|nr:hypothetical protein MKW92_043211 [Papaver armeniacum]
MKTSLEKILQDGKLLRQVNDLIVTHLHDNNLNQAVIGVASATMTPLKVESPPNKLIELVAKYFISMDLFQSCVHGLAVERDEVFRGVASAAAHIDYGSAVIPAGYGLVPLPRITSVDFRASKSFPKHETGYIFRHKCNIRSKNFPSKHLPTYGAKLETYNLNVARCARFSPDGRYVVTGSVDTSIKLFEISKIKQMMLSDTRDSPVRPIKRTFYDHLHYPLFSMLLKGPHYPFLYVSLFGMQPVNDLDFHHQSTILISGAKDHIVKLFDFSKTSAKRHDNHNVRSVSFHPSGEFLLSGICCLCFTFLFFVFMVILMRYVPWTNHSIPHLYDINTFQSSKDGSMRIHDGVTAQCVHSRVGAQGSVEATSASFTKDQRLVKQYVGATHTHNCASSNETKEFILSIDEPSNEIVVYDALTVENVARWPSNPIGAPRCPTESAFISCGTVRSSRLWKETL